MRAVDIITKKRGTFITDKNGNRVLNASTTLTKDEIKSFVEGYVQGQIPDYQVAAFLMAIYFNGMTFEETSFLTECMLYSGDVINLHGKENETMGLKPPFVDKHSTGGIGDKISIPLAPIVASCGVQIPMMSGRALGHTGGTLDKLESITGYNVNLSPKKFKEIIAKCGYGMTGQTKEIVPADRLLYALRDVTGTVESIPLITASILSKKVAEGSDALVFDVKYGSGAFMKTTTQAQELANSLVQTAQKMGKKASALITNMQTPLGYKIGNFLEIEESIECLQGKGPDDVMELTFALATQMLLLAQKAKTKEDALTLCKNAVTSGKALDVFLKNVSAQGGNPEKLMSECGKRKSPYTKDLIAEEEGFIKIDAYKVGLSGVTLGVGRNKTTDNVCADAGIVLYVKEGDKVKKGDLIMQVYGKDNDCLKSALPMLKNSITFCPEKPSLQPLIYKEII